MLQVVNIEEVFRDYFKVAMIPDRIIELGTMTGRFSNIIYKLRVNIDADFDMITIDQKRDIKDEYLPWNMIFCQMNIFLHIDLIIELIKPKTLILCDNGNKIKEVQLLAPHLKENCVIMAHDYCHDRDTFDPNGIWAHCEITWDDVKDLGLKPYYQEIMEKGAWLSLTNIK
jgi:hypothetical protein